ncbi:MAG TPA: prenyltransferase/squalene oxidase repeat-containing protein [Planctomycetota bacterium]|nr:prenyltransferase/squalene oxidase repeat-containing protein [Planctomycetota bacterium]
MKVVEKLAADFAVDLAKEQALTLQVARRESKDTELTKLIAAFQTLLDRPDDPGASTIAGRAHLNDLDFERAIPLLAKSLNEELKQLAKMELQKPDDALKQAALGDLWWALADAESLGRTRSIYRQRAKHWYEAALANVPAEKKAQVEQRLAQVPADVPKEIVLTPAVSAGLAWLAAAQSYDGHWDAKKYGANIKTDTACTALALLAFVRAGNFENHGRYQETVRRALQWLKTRQQADGLLFDVTDEGGHYGVGHPHGIAGLAVCEASAGNAPSARGIAKRALAYSTEIQQSESGSFRYAAKASGDLAVTVWFLEQYYKAGQAGLTINKERLTLALDYFKGYERTADGVTVYGYVVSREHPNAENVSYRRTMKGAWVEMLFGDKNRAAKSVEHATKQGGLPTWGANGEKADFWYWYFGTMASNLAGNDVAKRWNQALKIALERAQETAGKNKGSWPVTGTFSDIWGRVGQTSFACICLLGAQ